MRHELHLDDVPEVIGQRVRRVGVPVDEMLVHEEDAWIGDRSMRDEGDAPVLGS